MTELEPHAVRDNWVRQTPSWQSLRTTFFELDSAGRYALVQSTWRCAIGR